MNNCLKISTNVEPTPIAVNYGGQITGFNQESNEWIIDHYFNAHCAVNLLVKPNIGDKVCFVEMNNDYYITQLLSRSDDTDALIMQSEQKLHWIAPEFKITAFENLELISLNKIAITGKDYIVSVANTMIQQASQLLQQVGQFSLNAKGLLKLTGKQQVITAEKDVRIDGERINMG